jgi:arsenite methyltransferase
VTSPSGSVGSLNDPDAVRKQYTDETGLVARASLYAETTGPFAGDVAFDAVAEAVPARVLEVGCGTGWFAARVRRELAAEVVAIDQSPRMVELARAQGLDARVGDVQDLPFDDGEFDVVVCNWTLYHLQDLERGLAEIARVLRPGGRFAVSDVIADPDMDAATRADMQQWTGCVAGALTADEFRAALADAGMIDVEIRPTHRVHTHAASAIVRARKPEAGR